MEFYNQLFNEYLKKINNKPDEETAEDAGNDPADGE